MIDQCSLQSTLLFQHKLLLYPLLAGVSSDLEQTVIPIAIKVSKIFSLPLLLSIKMLMLSY